MNTTEEKTMTFKEVVTEVLYYYDVADLTKFYVPEDEYASEASAIIYSLRDVDDIRSLKWTVYDVFETFLSRENILPAVDERYRFIAEEIWDLWQEAIPAQSMNKMKEKKWK